MEITQRTGYVWECPSKSFPGLAADKISQTRNLEKDVFETGAEAVGRSCQVFKLV